MNDNNQTTDPPTLLEWMIDNDSVLVFAVERVDAQRYGQYGGEWRLADVVPT